MSRKKYVATMEQWNEIGEIAKQARQQLMDLCAKMENKVKIKYQDRLVYIIARLDKLRSDLEDEMFQQHPNEANIRVFFGKREKINLLGGNWDSSFKNLGGDLNAKI